MRRSFVILPSSDTSGVMSSSTCLLVSSAVQGSQELPIEIILALQFCPGSKGFLFTNGQHQMKTLLCVRERRNFNSLPVTITQDSVPQNTLWFISVEILAEDGQNTIVEIEIQVGNTQRWNCSKFLNGLFPLFPSPFVGECVHRQLVFGLRKCWLLNKALGYSHLFLYFLWNPKALL